MALEQVARVKGVTNRSGLDVFAANDRVKEQQRVIEALEADVRLPLIDGLFMEVLVRDALHTSYGHVVYHRFAKH